MSARSTLFAAAIALFIGVAAGAFGAHTVATKVTPERLAVWQTAVQYQMWHGLGLLGVGLLMRESSSPRLLAASAWLFVAGIVLFSGSLYGLVATGITKIGYVTPLGGIALLGGWAVLAVGIWRG